MTTTNKLNLTDLMSRLTGFYESASNEKLKNMILKSIKSACDDIQEEIDSTVIKQTNTQLMNLNLPNEYVAKVNQIPEGGLKRIGITVTKQEYVNKETDYIVHVMYDDRMRSGMSCGEEMFDYVNKLYAFALNGNTEELQRLITIDAPDGFKSICSSIVYDLNSEADENGGESDEEC